MLILKILGDLWPWTIQDSGTHNSISENKKKKNSIQIFTTLLLEQVIDVKFWIPIA